MSATDPRVGDEFRLTSGIHVLVIALDAIEGATCCFVQPGGRLLIPPNCTETGDLSLHPAHLIRRARYLRNHP